MKFIIERDALDAALSRIKSVVNEKHTIPILSSFLIVAQGDGVTFTASNLDIQASVYVAATVEGPGRVCADARKIREIARAAHPGAEIAMELKVMDSTVGSRLKITSGRSRFMVATLPAADFSLIEEALTDTALTLPASTWARMLNATTYALAGKGEVRMFLCGLHMVSTHPGEDGGVFRMVATSGAILAMDETPMPHGVPAVSIILPPQAVAVLEGMAGSGGDAPLSMALEPWETPTRATFSLGAATVVSKLFDATYPDYRRVIPHGSPDLVELDAGVFVECIQRALIIAYADGAGIQQVFLDITDGHATIRGRDTNGEESVEEMDTPFSGEVSIILNGKQILTQLARVRSESVILKLDSADAKAPVIVLAAGEPSGLSVFMPVIK